MKEKLLKALHYLVVKLQEPSTIKGLVLVVSAGSWAKLDGSNKGEVVMQIGLVVLGLIQILLPQSVLYKMEQK